PCLVHCLRQAQSLPLIDGWQADSVRLYHDPRFPTLKSKGIGASRPVGAAHIQAEVAHEGREGGSKAVTVAVKPGKGAPASSGDAPIAGVAPTQTGPSGAVVSVNEGDAKGRITVGGHPAVGVVRRKLLEVDRGRRSRR